MMTHKGYSGHVSFDDEAKIFHGEVLDTRDVITFQGQSVDEIETAFKDSVDDYLDFCKERKEEPDKPFSGKFVVRLEPSLHHKIYLKAVQSDKSLNRWITDTLTTHLTPTPPDIF
jgi:predicted HicB family RNase H-like nuclease